MQDYLPRAKALGNQMNRTDFKKLIKDSTVKTVTELHAKYDFTEQNQILCL